MAPVKRVIDEYYNEKSTSKIACVLTLLYPKNDHWHIAVIQRPRINPNDPHAGQLSLPGGKLEESDVSFEACALREAQEEIGIDATDVAIIGALSKLYVYISDFIIYPFVGFTNNEQKFEPQPSEVDYIHEVPLNVFTNHDNRYTRDIIVRNQEMKSVPYFDVDGKMLWGATAMILSEFGEIIKPILK
jgi:8-oxo-dGTP pyrophosphatase MutT (NUDIX family)